jgi:cytochrome P450
MLKNPEILNKLKLEVRSTFKSEDEITLTFVDNLEYILACLNEAMRAYPPAPVGLPREVPEVVSRSMAKSFRRVKVFLVT